MKRIFEKLVAALGIAAFSASALAVKINAPNDINNFNVAAQAAVTGLYVPTARQILTSSPLAGGGDLTADRTISLGTLGTAGTYGDATHTNVITTDAFGRISAITPTVITGVAASTAVTLVTPRTIAIQTGDVTSPGASFDGSANETAATTLATVNANVGACGSATQSSVVTLNAKGLATACTSTAITNVSGNAATATALATGRTISITGDLTYTSPSFTGAGNVTAVGTLATVNTNIGACGDATHVGVVTLNGKGLTTACTATTITGVPASTANTLATPRTIAIQTGDVTSTGASFDGSANETAATTLATTQSAAHTWSAAQTISGNLIASNILNAFGSAAGASQTINILGAAGGNRQVLFQTGSVNRWAFGANSTAESGSNVGTDFIIGRFADVGTFIDIPLTITRSTGLITTAALTSTGTINAVSVVASSGVIAPLVTVNAAAGTNRNIAYQSAGANRVLAFVTSTAESGSNAGSDYDIRTYADDGTTQLTNTVLTRSTGAWAFPSTATFGGGITVTGRVAAVAYMRPGVTTVAGLATVDSSPQAGDMLAVSDAVACATNTTPTGGGSTTCPLVYSGAAWKAIVTH